MADVSLHNITHWTTPQPSARPVESYGGYGAFANAPVVTGQAATWGGKIVTAELFAHYPPFVQTHSLQIEENKWQLPSLSEWYAGYFSPHLPRRIDRWRRKQFAASRTAVNGRASTTHFTS